MIDFTRTPFHMPGHKRNADFIDDALRGSADATRSAFFTVPLPYAIDVTEIDGADDLHDMCGDLAQLAALAARLYGAERAFPMVNGTTGGVLAAVRAAATLSDGRKIIMTRESHRSVYNAAELCGLEPVYLESTAPQSVADTIAENPDAACVLITSPTYLGAVADIAGIAAAIRTAETQNAQNLNTQNPNAEIPTAQISNARPTAHGAVGQESMISGSQNAQISNARPTAQSVVGPAAMIRGSRRLTLIIDSAHGAHFGFHDAFPLNATRLGADIEIASLHKTLPALTQASLLLCRNDFAGEVARQLRVFETSSPSYVLLASIERCLRLLDERGAEVFAQYVERLQRFYARTRLEPADDNGKIVIPATNGAALMDALRKHGIELEMCGADYALAMTSIADTDAAFDKLADALDACKSLRGKAMQSHTYRVPQRVCAPDEARRSEGELVPYTAAQGRTAREYVWAYPPGVPLIVAGERIDAHVIAAIDALYASGIEPRSDFGALPMLSVIA